MFVLVLSQISVKTDIHVNAEDLATSTLVLTLGADLSEEQKSYVRQFFGITNQEINTITITNADERSQLEGLVPDERIGTHTLSCALLKIKTEGGIQVKTANMNYVTSNMIASTLSTSGVYNCEVLTAAPFEVSGTGALTGVMMAYEAAMKVALDPEKKALANEELVITGTIAETVGQAQATLVVNDIKINIARDQITGEAQVKEVVDNVIDVTERAAEEYAAEQGLKAPQKLGQVEHEKLYEFGNKFSSMGYQYTDLQPTLERVTSNVVKDTGILDPIVDTFTTLDESGLSFDSILLSTDDTVFGNSAIINATDTVALGDHPAEEIEVFTGEVTLEKAGSIKAERFINHTNLLAYKDTNGSYALMDLNGNILTESIFTNDMRYTNGFVKAVLNDGTDRKGLISKNGSVMVPFEYDEVKGIEVKGDTDNTLESKWAVGITYVEGGTEENHDAYGWDSSNNRIWYVLDKADIYHVEGENSVYITSLTRNDIYYMQSSGDYLNIQSRNMNVTTYDSSFNVLQTVEYLSNFGQYDAEEAQMKAIENATGLYIGSIRKNYAVYFDYGNGVGEDGIIDLYGNVIIPAMFDWMETSGDDFSYMSNGYFCGKKDNQYMYCTAGGNVTATITVQDGEYISNYGMSATYKNSDGQYTIYSADGIVSPLGITYDYINCINGSKGMFYEGYKNGKYCLIDWHGNELLSGSDGYSLSANGNYLIAQDGYTSATLYLVNGAAPVNLVNSAGAAEEMNVEVQVTASTEAYTSDVTIQELAELPFVDIYDFIGESYLISVRGKDTTEYAMADLSGKQLTDAIYRGFEYKCDLIRTSKTYDKCLGRLYGVILPNGAEAIPCEYHNIDILSRNWVIAYQYVEGTKDDCDTSTSGPEYYKIDTATVYYIGESEVSRVTLTRDQIKDADVSGEYLIIQDRNTELYTAYNSEFSAIETSNSFRDFYKYNPKYVLAQKLSDQTGYDVLDDEFSEGYEQISKAAYARGIIDAEGNIVLEPIYDRVHYMSDSNHSEHYNINGYFGVTTHEDKCGFVSSGNVVTCEAKYRKDDTYFNGMSLKYKESDKSYTLVSGDGVESKGYDYLASVYGKIWEARKKGQNNFSIIDWHGNVLIDQYYRACYSEDIASSYLIVQKEANGPFVLYGIDGATVEDAVGEGTAVVDTVRKGETEAVEATEVTTEAAPEAENVMEDTTAGSDVNALLESAKSLIEKDINANADSIVILLEQSKEQLEDNAAVIDSAILLIESGSASESAVIALLDSVIG